MLLTPEEVEEEEAAEEEEEPKEEEEPDAAEEGEEPARDEEKATVEACNDITWSDYSKETMPYSKWHITKSLRLVGKKIKLVTDGGVDRPMDGQTGRRTHSLKE